MVILSHNTALRYWLSPSAEAAVPAGSLRGANASPLPLAYARPLEACGFGSPAHILLPRSAPGAHKRSFAQHEIPSALLGRRIYRVGPDLLVCDPATAYVQACSTMTPAEGVFWGNALCSRYVICDAEAAGFRPRQPITRREELLSLATGCSVPGAQRARQALSSVRDGAASPMENALAVKLALPLSRGGAGFPDLRLNHRLDIPGRLQRTAGRSHYKCDVFLPEHDIAIEYDSDAFHTGTDRIASDARRRNTLEAMGITVVTVTRQQLIDPFEFFGVVQRLYAIVGRRLQVRYDPIERQIALSRSFAALLKESKTMPQRLGAPLFYT